jgi:acyl-CoA hydrolase
MKMSTYMEEYKKKLITAEEAARLVKSNAIIDYGMFATKPVDFDMALGNGPEMACRTSLYAEPGRFCQFLRSSKNDPEQKNFPIFLLVLYHAGSQGGRLWPGSSQPFNYHEATLLAYNQGDFDHLKPQVWCAQTTPMDKHGCFNFGLGNSHNRGMALKADIAIVEVNQNMPNCLGGNDEYVHISEIDYIIEGSNTPIFSTPPAPEATPEEKRSPNTY